MATSDGRRKPGRSAEQFVQDVWDASENPPGMEELLRKYRLRESKDERVQKKSEETHRRNTILTEFSKRPGYDILVAFLKRIEGDAYFKLRNIKEKPQGLSLEAWVGMQNGKLEVIEDIRLMFTTARSELKWEQVKEQMKNNSEVQEEI